MSEDTLRHFQDQMAYEDDHLGFLRLQTANLTSEVRCFISQQALKFASADFLKTLELLGVTYSVFQHTHGYADKANAWADALTNNPLRIGPDGAGLAAVVVTGLDAQWRYPFESLDHYYMRAEGAFRHAYDSLYDIDVVEAELESGYRLTIAATRSEDIADLDMPILFKAALGEFRVTVDHLVLPKVAFGHVIKLYYADMGPVSCVCGRDVLASPIMPHSFGILALKLDFERCCGDEARLSHL